MQRKKDENSLNRAGDVTIVKDDGVAAGMDLNHIYIMGVSNLAGGEDACMVRFIAD